MKLTVLHDEKDEKIVETLISHLVSLEKNYRLETWNLGKISPGIDIELEKEKHIKNTDIIVVCISANYLAKSDYDSEIQQIEDAKLAKDDLLILGILATPCFWEVNPLNSFTIFPENKIPISQWDSIDIPITQIIYYLKGILDTIPDSIENEILSKISDLSNRKEIAKRKYELLNSNYEVRKLVDDEFNSLKNLIIDKINKIADQSHYKITMEPGNQYLILSYFGISLSLNYFSKFGNSTSADNLNIRFFDKTISKQRSLVYFDGNPQITREIKYTVDANEKLELGWNDSKNEYYSSQKIADWVVKEFFEILIQIENKNL